MQHIMQGTPVLLQQICIFFEYIVYLPQGEVNALCSTVSVDNPSEIGEITVFPNPAGKRIETGKLIIMN